MRGLRFFWAPAKSPAQQTNLIDGRQGTMAGSSLYTPADINMTRDGLAVWGKSNAYINFSTMYARFTNLAYVTFAALVHLPTSPPDGYFFSLCGASVSTVLMSMRIYFTQFEAKCYVNGSTPSTTTSMPSTPSYAMVVGLYNGSQVRIYLNGAYANSISASGNLGWGAAATPLCIFNLYDGSDTSYAGKILGVWVWDRVLTDAAIAQFSARPWDMLRWKERPFRDKARGSDYLIVM
jgi:hypothetical protein